MSELLKKLHELKAQKTCFPLSLGQKGLWWLQKNHPASTAYNIPMCLHLKHPVKPQLLEKALQAVVETHPQLGTVIVEREGEPCQIPLYGKEGRPVELHTEDLSGLDEPQLLSQIKSKVKTPFRLDEGSLIRAYIFQRASQQQTLLLVVHHIVIDGQSAQPLLRTLFSAYSRLEKGEPFTAAADTPYAGYVEWERQFLTSAWAHSDLAFWKERLAAPLPVLELPIRSRTHSPRRSGARTHSELVTAECFEGIRKMASSAGITPAVLFLAIYKLLLYRYTGEPDMVIGMPTAGRHAPQFEECVGYFVNMVAIRSRIDSGLPFKDFLRHLQLTLADALDHSAYPFPALLKELRIPRAHGSSPVFQAEYVYQNASVFRDGVSIGGELLAEWDSAMRQEGEFELVLEVCERQRDFVVHFKFDEDLYCEEDIKRMAGHYIRLLNGVIGNDALNADAYPLLGTDERRRLIVEWNSTNRDFDLRQCLHELVEKQAEKTPHRDAIRHQDTVLSYGELNSRANRLAHRLRALGVSPDAVVGLCFQRGIDMVISMLAVLKAGGAYVPLDPSYPADRLGYMCSDCQPLVILSHGQVPASVQAAISAAVPHVPVMDIVAFTSDEGSIDAANIKPAQIGLGSGNLAYIIYTSGSSGKPKGVAIEHRNAVNFILWAGAEFAPEEMSNTLFSTSLNFDLAVFESFLPLSTGNTVEMVGSALDLISRKEHGHSATLINTVPSAIKALLDARSVPRGIRSVNLAGEPLRSVLVERLFNETNVVNVRDLYGPSETTTYSTWTRMSRETGAAGHIGRPIANTQIYILDRNAQPVPIGVVGEIHIAGAGVARGYLNQPELTKEKFVPNPFDPDRKGLMYRTGDLGRYRSDGNIEFVGRIGTQVKLRGYRIELGEIESRLLAYPGIKEAVAVIDETDVNDRRLLAYYTIDRSGDAGSGGLSMAGIREHLKTSLPDYMVPAHLHEIAAIPLTPNGKVDRKFLAGSAMRQPEAGSAPATQKSNENRSGAQIIGIERRVSRIWQEILKTGSVGPEDGFFDSGGDSLLALTLAQRISKEFGCEFTSLMMFKYGSIREMSRYLVQLPCAAEASVPPANDHPDTLSAAGSFQSVPAIPPYYQSSLAIVGMSCQFPGAKDHREFWSNLKRGKESVSLLSGEELRDLGIAEELIRDENYVRIRSTIDGKYAFDPGFFKITPKDASLMDPQLRLLLQHAWSAVEDAGYRCKDIPDTSVFISASNSGFSGSAAGEAFVMTSAEDYLSWVLAQSGTIPAIISNKLGFTGPSYAVHSNCSSSLIGLHAAYQAIQSGDSAYALVGAATVLPYESLGYVHQRGLNFSGDGHVKTFDADADGMVGGEGVAVLLVKNAAAAIADGDHIYALVRGIGVNNDGSDKTGFYAPSIKGQSEAIEKVLRNTGVHPETIQYIEAHGTGTALGDPIEVGALREAYSRHTGKLQFCGIGSVKSNIGHLDTAAGLAGCIKTALCLEHGEIPPTINFERPNPKLAIDASPFYIVDKLMPWPAVAHPRRAALSSFGLGGTNAHVVLEQATITAQTLSRDLPSRRIFPLSARNPERLSAYARNLLDFLKERVDERIDIDALAFTLQTGRERMSGRVAFIAGDLPQLIGHIGAFLNREESHGRWLDAGTLPVAEEALKLAEAWIEGDEVDWGGMYPSANPRRISLPTYPFAKEEFRPSRTASIQMRTEARDAAIGHPLLQRHVRDENGHRFSTIFTGDEFFLRDHVIQGRRVMPGVVFLEMARAAVERAVGAAPASSPTRGIRLRNIVWPEPIAVLDTPVEIHLRLSEGEDIVVEIFSANTSAIADDGSSQADVRKRVHCQAIATVTACAMPAPVSWHALEAACERELAAADLYSQLPAIGFYFGPSFRAVQSASFCKDDAGDPVVLEKLSLPGCVADTRDRYVLHPSMMDAALGILLDNDGDKPTLPFVLQELNVYRPCSGNMRVLVRHAAGNRIDSPVQKFDIDLLDEWGNPCAVIRGYSRRVLQRPFHAAQEDATLLLRPVWVPVQGGSVQGSASDVIRKTVFVSFREQAFQLLDRSVMSNERFGFAREDGISDPANRFNRCATDIAGIVRALAKNHPGKPLLIQVAASGFEEESLQRGLAGLLKTVRREQPRMTAQFIQVCRDISSDELMRLTERCAGYGSGVFRYSSSARLEREQFEEIAAGNPALPWKSDGAYLVTGGASKVGLMLAKEIARQCANVSLYLAGRSAPSAEVASEIRRLNELGARAEYVVLDVGDKAAVDGFMAGLREGQRKLNGMIHAAGIVRDSLLINKSDSDFEDVLRPKVNGLVYLDEATRDFPLDFVLCFSSISGTFGNPGQSDYAAANAFMGAYAAYRNELAARGQRYGHALSIDWPPLKNGGMRAAPGVEAENQARFGLAPLEDTGIIETIHNAYASRESQVVVLHGDPRRMLEKFALAPVSAAVAVTDSALPAEAEKPPSGAAMLSGAIEQALINMVLDQTKLKRADLDLHAEWIALGFDSLSLTVFSNQLNRAYGLELAPTIFFEYPTLTKLAHHLAETCQAELSKHFPRQGKALHAAGSTPSSPDIPSGLRQAATSGPYGAEDAMEKGPSQAEPIAIVGMSGSFPQALDVQELWENLDAGNDAICEIPPDRWDWRAIYGNPATDVNKTNIKWGGFISGMGDFDPLFFGISPREAELIDPQQRLLLVHAWKALEDAGYSASSLSGSNTAVFVSIADTGYSDLLAQANVPLEGASATGSIASVGPNRLSYFLNLHGPSELVDTACSSSLVAIHRAMLALRHGHCEMAIVGGVQAILTPWAHISFSKAGMLSPEGKCKAFSSSANGYVRGEGVGILVLKKLRAAERDGDHIYGLILSSAENHGGRANSLTAPNPRAQAELIKTALRQSGIDPRTIGYIEAHGTGTALGDPIEIQGLLSAFRELHAENADRVPLPESYCGIGSIKTNLGHLELAAGVAGVIKVLLQLKHRTLVKSLHCDDINPYIRLEGSPFYIVRQQRPWEAIKDAQGQALPRRAGVSSFGFGGVNAHVILEEYVPAEREFDAQTKQPVIVVLSAKNEARLQEQAGQLLEAIHGRNLHDADLKNLAWTLQAGREAMEVRLACVAGSLQELQAHLENYRQGRSKQDGLYYGETKKSRDTVSLFAADEDLRQAMASWIAKGKLAKLAQLWVKGMAIDWSVLYGTDKPRRMSLPTYPFAKERYWVPRQAGSTSGPAPASLPAPALAHTLHPLVQRNTSVLGEQRFSSIFTGKEFFLRDHVVKGERVLPGVAHLEMARAAVTLASGLGDDGFGVRLENVIFARPIVVSGEALEVHVSLHLNEDQSVRYEIYGIDNDHRILYSQGQALLCAAQDRDRCDIETLHSRCGTEVFSGVDCYAMLANAGLDLGPAFRGVVEARLGHDDEGQPFLIGTLALPEGLSSSRGSYVLHPSMMDSAIQAGIGLRASAVQAGRLELPFALDSLEVSAPVPDAAYVIARCNRFRDADSAVEKLSFDITDDAGNVCVRLNGFSSRLLESAPRSMQSAPGQTASHALGADALVGELMLVPVWNAISLPRAEVSPDADCRLLMIGGDEVQHAQVRRFFPNASAIAIHSADAVQAIAGRIARQARFDHLLWIVDGGAMGNEASARACIDTGMTAFRLFKALLHAGYGERPLAITVLTRNGFAISGQQRTDAAHASIHGLAGSIGKEYPNWKIRLRDLSAEEGWPWPDIFSAAAGETGDSLVYRHGQWHSRQLHRCSADDDGMSRFVRGGVYVILGGAGGIGEALSAYLIAQYQAQLVWIGRRHEQDEAIREKKQRLALLGPEPLYIRADAADEAALARAYQRIKSHFPSIHGLIHSLIDLRDQSLAQMTEETFAAGFRTKAVSIVNMGEVFKEENLGFVLVFSSIVSHSTPAGQCNYAAGCMFTDAYAPALQEALHCPVKAVNWGYWGSVGVVAAEPYRARMTQLGIGSVEAPAAMAFLETVLASPLDQAAFLVTSKPEAALRIGVNPAGEVAALARCKHRFEAASFRTAALDSGFERRRLEEEQSLETILAKLLWATLDALGLFLDTGIDVRRFSDRIRLPLMYRKWLAQSIRILAERGYLEQTGDSIRATGLREDAATVWREWDRFAAKARANPDQRAQILLLDAVLRGLPHILTGETSATAVMFPDSSLHLVEGIYKHNRQADYFNDVLADNLIAYIDARIHAQPDVRLRIVEIGAGTGGTSALLFERLKPYSAHMETYCYTDVSRAFLLHAQEHYAGQAPYLSTRLFDVEQTLSPQGFVCGEFDVAIGANVLHATRDIRRTIRNAKALLKDGGLLLLNELTGTRLFSQMTFGLLEGWWLYEDEALRLPGSPALAPDTWRTLLCEEGFGRIAYPAEKAHRLGQQVIAALGDGVIRQTCSAQSAARTGQINRDRSDASVSNASVSNAMPLASPGDANPVQAGKQQLHAHVQRSLTDLVSEVLKIAEQDIDPAAELSLFGFDSITVTVFSNALHRKYGLQVSPTVFFEYPTIERLAGYLAHAHEDALRKHFALQWNPAPAMQAATAAQVPAARVVPVLRRKPGLQREDSRPDAGNEPLAIIGISGRFPMSKDIEELWDNIKEGRDCIGVIGAERWDIAAGDAREFPAGVMEGVDHFDPLFFSISPREAEEMDPQQRLLMTFVWKAIEDAGYAPHSLAGSKTAVFIGTGSSGYSELLARSRGQAGSSSATGMVPSLGPNRISYLLDLHGPSEPVETACSSSLVAIHRAMLALRHGHCEMAIVGGVQAILTPWAHISFSKAGMLSPEGKCKAFSSSANGYVRGEGVGILVLKKLRAAERDGDHIYGLILSSAENHGGRANSLTAPNPRAQAELIKTALRQSGIDPRTIGYIEAHGTGTALGDPIEIQGLLSAFRELHAENADRVPLPESYCGIGSIKTNLGHLELAAGVAGVIKVLLQLKHRTLVKSLHCDDINPYIRLEGSPFYIVRQQRPWEAIKDAQGQALPRRAGVSSFGFGGVNAHVILEEYVPAEREFDAQTKQPVKLPVIVVLSAKNEARLQEQAGQLLEAIHGRNLHDADLKNLAWTLQAGREAMEVRLACVAGSLQELQAHLENYRQGRSKQDGLYYGETKKSRDTVSLFAADEDLRQAMASWIAKGKLAKLAQLWVKGMAIDWSVLYGTDKPRRMSLPTYPFAKERYWVPRQAGSTSGSALASLPAPALAGTLQVVSMGGEHHRTETLLFAPVWIDKPVTADTSSPKYEQHWVFLAPGLLSPDAVMLAMRGVRCEVLPEQHDIAEQFHAVFCHVFEVVKSLLASGTSARTLIQVVLPEAEKASLLTGLSGLFRTAHIENPKLDGQLIFAGAGESGDTVIARLLANRSFPGDSRIRYAGARRQIVRWEELTAETNEMPALWKDGGVYLISGGMGALGLIFATEIATQCRNPILILSGRSSLDEAKRRKLEDLRRLGASVEYRQTDISEREAVAGIVQDIANRFGKLNGIIHAAGVVQDSFVINKTALQIEDVLRPKLHGLVNLDEASRAMPLDCFICFSSAAGVHGNPGQADYASANAFMDAYAGYRNGLVSAGKRHGRTLSIDWPLWSEGGMRMNAAAEESLLSRFGMIPLRTASGIRAFYRAWLSVRDQVMVLEGAPGKMRTSMSAAEEGAGLAAAGIGADPNKVSDSDLKAGVMRELKALFGQAAKLDTGILDAEEPLENYGIDSVIVTQANREFAAIFGDISKTLFYEFQTLSALADYFVAHHRNACMKWTCMTEQNAIRPVGQVPEKKTITQAAQSLEPAAARTGMYLAAPAGKGELREPIAIIGMSGRYARAGNLREFWNKLKDGVDCISEVPEERWTLDGFFSPDRDAGRHGMSYSKWGGFLDGFADFDPLFFGISPREAITIDPQERLFIESCWELLEDAGYTREKLEETFQGRVGVFAGITKNGFELHTPESGDAQAFPRTSFGSVANRVSYLFNLKGPSMPIDTMCSASLTAIHEACEHIYRNECELAIAGGVNLYLHPSSYVWLSSQRMLSQDGKCKSFGHGADGFVPGEGVGAVLLKPLSRAIEDEDRIYGVIRGTSINHGGKTNGYTVPSPQSQAALIRNALDKAGVSAREVSYIEAHGTGTDLGDPIEIAGLTQAFRKDTDDTQFCAIGSVKSNIGHCESAAGIAGVTKVLLQMQHGYLAPSLHCATENPNIDFRDTPFAVQKELAPWERPVLERDGEFRECPRIAGISSFGAGGANAHVIIQEYPAAQREQPASVPPLVRPAVIVLSAKDNEQLRAQFVRLHDWLEERDCDDGDLADIAYTLQIGREAMEERAALLANSIDDLKAKLKSYIGGQPGAGIFRGRIKPSKEAMRDLAGDEDMAKTIDAWIAKRKFERLLGLWIDGQEIDWHRLYGMAKPRRISLPSYPFAKERYWHETTGIRRRQDINPSRQRTQKSDETYNALIDQLINNELSVVQVARQLNEKNPISWKALHERTE